MNVRQAIELLQKLGPERLECELIVPITMAKDENSKATATNYMVLHHMITVDDQNVVGFITETQARFLERMGIQKIITGEDSAQS